jgi:very-short-patch-repair endonuclease
MIDKYGTEHPLQNQELFEKAKSTNLEKYGQEYVLQVEEFKEKGKQTNIQKYGCPNPQQNEEIKNKTKKTCKERYGYENPSYSPEIKDKILQKMIDRGDARIIDGLVIKEHAKNTGYAVSTFNRLIREYGFEEASKMHRSEQYSSLELIFKNLLNQNNINFNQHSRLYYNDNNYYIPDFQIDKLFIEIDGLFWHCDCHDKMDRSYHANKQKIYKEHGYDSLFFREDELRDKFDIVKSIVLNKLGKSQRIFARKCEIKEISNNEANKFFSDNHLMGRGKGRTFCLQINDEIVSAIRIKRLKNKEYEVSRFCHKLNTNIIGGFSKLLRFVENHIDMDQLLTFIDMRYGKGEYLKDFGFQYIHTYPSFKWTNGINTYHRLKFPSTSGYDNGFFKIYDCGQAKFVKNFIK